MVGSWHDRVALKWRALKAVGIRSGCSLAGFAIIVLASPAVALAWQGERKRTLLQSLDGGTRAKVLAALAGLVLLGMAMIAFVWWGGRMTRRYMNSSSYDNRRRKPTPYYEDDWAEKPLIDIDIEDDE